MSVLCGIMFGMTTEAQKLAEEALHQAAYRIARQWVHAQPSVHFYDLRMPPPDVLGLFDETISQVMTSIPELHAAYDLARRDDAALESKLLDILIMRTRNEVKSLQDSARSKSFDAGTTLLADNFQSPARVKRLALLQKRDEQFRMWITQAMSESHTLFERNGVFTLTAINVVLGDFITLIASDWSDHGGRSLNPTLSSFLSQVVATFVTLAFPDSRDSAEIIDSEQVQSPEQKLVAKVTLDIYIEALLDEARPHFTHEVTRDWSRSDLETALLAAIDKAASLFRSVADREESTQGAHPKFKETLKAWQVSHPAPACCPYGTSPEGAEHWCCDWLVHMGLQGATVTQFVGDGGIDVVSPSHIAQVKHYAGSVAIAEIRELAGVAFADGRKPLFFTSGHYPSQAEEYADKTGIALFRYDVYTGEVSACNSVAQRALASGFLPVN